jgi:predicted DNA-binding transcriptional regulator AlpA
MKPKKKERPITQEGIGDIEPLLSAEQACKILTVSRVTLWRLMMKQGLPFYRITGAGDVENRKQSIRFRASEIENWIKSRSRTYIPTTRPVAVLTRRVADRL